MSIKRVNARAPSPTPTSFSGISSYRTTDSHRPRDNRAPAGSVDYRHISKIHFEELSKYLAAYLARSQGNSRATARQKLTRLTIQQFHELSTDVYDELMRRKAEQQLPFLPVREDFHPKRNQARQKLATLPTSRFEDLSSDVYFELARRYPEFLEDPSGGRRDENYDDYPAPDFPSTNNPNAPSRTGPPSRASVDRASDNNYSSGPRPPQERRRPSEIDFQSGRGSQDKDRRPDDNPYPLPGPRIGDEALSASLASRRKPSQDTSRRSEDNNRGQSTRRPSASASVSNTSDGTATGAPPPQSTTATSGMIIPIKSTMEEEYIEVPYGREQRESSGTVGTPGADARDVMADDSASDYPSPHSPRSPPVGGLSGLSARLKLDEDDDDINASNKSGDELYDKYGRSSVNSDRSIGGSRGPGGNRSSVAGEMEKMRRDYEYKIATLETQLKSSQRDLSASQGRESQWKDAEIRANKLEDELDVLRQKAEEQAETIAYLQHELEEMHETLQRERDRESRKVHDDEEELQILRDRCERLESERGQGGQNEPDLDQLRNDMEGLLFELDSLNRRNDELMTSKDSDLAVIRDLDTQLKEYKRKYEQAKTELRSVKATSQLFLPPPKPEKSEDQLPVAQDGGVLDIHITAFMTGVDSLLTAGRSSAPTRVLGPMKTIVNAVASIVDDVRTFERKPSPDIDVDLEALRNLRDRAEATLSNLVAATKTHATSHGMSPVSLLDAAASHVSSTITEIAGMVFVRKATKAEQDAAQYGSPPSSAMNGFMPSLRSVDESGTNFSQHQRMASQASMMSNRNRCVGSPSSSPQVRLQADARRRAESRDSSDQTNSPPPLFYKRAGQRGRGSSESSVPAEGEDAWMELKPYLEAQTEAIVYAIQSVLSAVRSPTPPPTLSENLTQIITIVSSIVAVCNDSIPSASSQQGTDLLRELIEHANKLSEVQSLPEITKESRQVMAKSSFAIANAMKGLMKLR